MEARCQCARIQFTTPLPEPMKIYICHCHECRHQSSSSYGVTAIFPLFEIPDPNGEISIYTRETLLSRSLQCLFCRNCGARLMHRARGEKTLSVKGGCLVGLDKTMMARAIHIWCKEAVVEIPDGVERWEEEPDD